MRNIKPGEIQLYAPIGRVLQGGKHTITVEQIFGASGLPTQSTQMEFEVDGPRWFLMPDDVHQRFPVPGATKTHDNELPMVVLGRRTLPWERSADLTPWMVLVTFVDDELPAPEICEKSDTVEKLWQADEQSPKELGSRPADVELQQPIRWLEIPSTLAAEVFPTRAEAALLTHVRRVSTEDKELLGQDQDGWFAAILGNRLPEPSKVHRVYLLSVEGRDLDQLGGVPVTRRFVILDRWSFTATEGATFASYGDTLELGLLGGWLEDRTPGVLQGPVEERDGHIPLWARSRSGEPYTAAYRGPCVPKVRAPPALPAVAHHAADQLIQDYNGHPDLSYAMAFELGRLLALADGRFAQALLDWRRAAFDSHGAALKARRLETSVGLAPGSGGNALDAGDDEALELAAAAKVPPGAPFGVIANARSLDVRARFEALPVPHREVGGLLRALGRERRLPQSLAATVALPIHLKRKDRRP